MATNNDQEEPVVDPAVVEELEDMNKEDPLITEYFTGGADSDTERVDFVETWFPDADEWQGKTDISYVQARNMALVRIIPLVFDEVEELKPMLDQLVDNYEKYLTSVDGVAREQQASILRSMFGGPGDMDDETTGMVKAALTGSMGDRGDDDG